MTKQRERLSGAQQQLSRLSDSRFSGAITIHFDSGVVRRWELRQVVNDKLLDTAPGFVVVVASTD